VAPSPPSHRGWPALCGVQQQEEAPGPSSKAAGSFGQEQIRKNGPEFEIKS
jgi:hypothetical protein